MNGFAYYISFDNTATKNSHVMVCMTKAAYDRELARLESLAHIAIRDHGVTLVKE